MAPVPTSTTSGTGSPGSGCHATGSRRCRLHPTFWKATRYGLRPTVAVSAYIVQCAHALHEHPAMREKLANGSADDLRCFVQEVRRFYPFFPFAAAKVKRSFEWQGYPFPSGRKVFLDLYGTNHDPRNWNRPDEFNPERFREWDGNPFTLIPQDGGDHHENHRCPGKWIAIEQMKVATDVLATRCDYEVPAQNLDIAMNRLPAIPRSHFIISNVRMWGCWATMGRQDDDHENAHWIRATGQWLDPVQGQIDS